LRARLDRREIARDAQAPALREIPARVLVRDRDRVLAKRRDARLEPKRRLRDEREDRRGRRSPEHMGGGEPGARLDVTFVRLLARPAATHLNRFTVPSLSCLLKRRERAQRREEVIAVLRGQR